VYCGSAIRAYGTHMSPPSQESPRGIDSRNQLPFTSWISPDSTVRSVTRRDRRVS